MRWLEGGLREECAGDGYLCVVFSIEGIDPGGSGTYIGGAQHPLALGAELDRHARQRTACGNLGGHDVRGSSFPMSYPRWYATRVA